MGGEIWPCATEKAAKEKAVRIEIRNASHERLCRDTPLKLLVVWSRPLIESNVSAPSLISGLQSISACPSLFFSACHDLRIIASLTHHRSRANQ
jgi:hypothetical protein